MVRSFRAAPSHLCCLTCAVLVLLPLHSVARAGQYTFVLNSENAQTATAPATAAPRGNGMGYHYEQSDYKVSGATYKWVDDPNDPNDAADSRRARHSVQCTTGQYSLSGTDGIAGTRTDFFYMSGAQSSYLETTDGAVTSGANAASPVDDIAPEGNDTSPVWDEDEDKWYLHLSTPSLQVTNKSYITPNRQLTASTGASTVSTVANSVRPFPQ